MTLRYTPEERCHRLNSCQNLKTRKKNVNTIQQIEVDAIRLFQVRKEVDKIERYERKKLNMCSVNGNRGVRMKRFINFNRGTVDFS